MFCHLRTLADALVITRDGDQKPIRNFLFDDRSWSIRFLVVDVGSWFARRLVVIPTTVVDEPDWAKKVVAAHLTKDQLLKSPNVDSAKPVSRQQQLALNELFGWADFAYDWCIPRALVPAQRGFPVHTQDDPHLRSTLDLTGYQVWATDGYLGRLEDFVLEQASWHINYLMVKVGDWVLNREQFVSTLSVRAISWADHRVTLDRRRNAASEYLIFHRQNTRDENSFAVRHNIAI
jgi:hypothetical protein